MSGTAPYALYVLQCADGTFYAGITTDVVRRVAEHNSSAKGAKYTRTRRPVRLVYSEAHPSRSAALVAEAAFRQLSRAEKLARIGRPISGS
ncbi:MAG: GIY-YIG nuclease family protein [Patescibacteria group bacterium]|jgi:putative endonuclease